MTLDNTFMKKLEASNWNENNFEFHVFNSQKELFYYLERSKEGKWWREEYGRFDFEQCVFNFKVTQWVNIFDSYAWFKNAEFKENVTFNKAIFKQNAEFEGCRFLKHVDFSNCIFEEQFYPTSFTKSVNFRYAKFKSHVTFSSKYFKNFADFSYTKFYKGVSFYESVFNDEFKFHDSKIYEDAFFESVEFRGKVNSWNLTCSKNISFKWANFREKANFSEMSVVNGFANFHGANFEKNAYFYSSNIHKIDLTKSVIEKGVYFLDATIQNFNRETSRIIKHEFIKQNNRIESLKYHSLEMEEYEKELFGEKKALNFSFLRFFRDFYLVFTKGNRTNKFVIFINRVSNGFNLLPFRGVTFTLIATFISYLIFIYVVKLENNIELEYSYRHIGINFRQTLQFLNITDWKYYPFQLKYNWAYGVLFLGRIIVSYGIYQTVQAFRKFGST
jgi:uncharacterized protein YjbI with pentapeptide repeats